jgi:hypothetical protein
MLTLTALSVPLAAALKSSTALSQAVITGGAIASVSFNVWKRHPDNPQVPLIDFQLVLVFTPVLLMGVNAGGAGTQAVMHGTKPPFGTASQCK